MIGVSAAQQSVPPSGSPSSPPAATQPAPKADKMAPRTAGSAQFIGAQQPDQFLASRFKGTEVIGPDSKSIGSVSDILFEKNGTIKAYVVSVGGFLGIGSKEVALAPQSFEVVAGDKSKSESDKLKLSMSAEQLKQAQAFRPYNPPRVTTGAGGPGGTRPMNPAGSK
ncbi:MAG TPA: PRC-barrel domain-containing protein [Xanthobacteraceae bacterium]|nr:PRC-barrel domain-containing protein [Xanthobacteraceae bacterium]